MIRVSFIIPVYNAALYIERCLNSIFSLGIAEEEMEILCVDDCSPDNSCEIIEKFTAIHTSIRLIHHKENKRQGGARNTGIREAKGKYAIFVDSDDMLPLYNLQNLLAYMDETNLDLLLGNGVSIGRNGERRWGNAPREESRIMRGLEFFKDEYIHKVAYGVVWLGIYRTELLKRVRPFVEYVRYEDGDWCQECAYGAKLLQYKPIVLYYYMENMESTTHSVPIDGLVQRIEQGLRVWKWALTTQEEHDAVMESAEDFCTWNLLGLGSFWKYSIADRKKFYQAFSAEDMKTMQSWYHRYKAQWMIEYPVLTQCVLFFVAPLLRFAWRVKKMIKK